MTLPRSVEEAVNAEASGQVLHYLFFWGHRPPRDGGVGAGCLSQWWEAGFTEDGHLFPTAEHYMMAHKAWLFGDEETAAKVLAAPSPGEAKELGRSVQGYSDKIWTAQRSGIVVRGSIAKFTAHPDLRDFLLGTRDRVLVEASPYDRVWGIGVTATAEKAASPKTWKGLNLLGFALMDARDALS
ncbi:NADAR family protein [Herbidospora mongoliensis]|uniref:NADAR family protein n=1 Tax=Herbidospora mongoliensis TaxID=688067 RepID=UPI00082E9145|nr:NADAR family protein [Herbidospora mongoliensis]